MKCDIHFFFLFFYNNLPINRYPITIAYECTVRTYFAVNSHASSFNKAICFTSGA
ncbi:hypothetical protein BMB171_C4196 [Bacillus thuringiensis BMB171]|nr:hypothetical protein BMB171_C4196 [Bacillus thuringiensis BMB171]